MRAIGPENRHWNNLPSVTSPEPVGMIKDPVRGQHHGQWPLRHASKAVHMTCTRQDRHTHPKALASRAPSTHDGWGVWIPFNLNLQHAQLVVIDLAGHPVLPSARSKPLLSLVNYWYESRTTAKDP